MGVLPLVFEPGVNRQTLKLDGSELFDITGLNNLKAGMHIPCICYVNGGILHYTLRQLVAAKVDKAA